jgi:hypothetical protein
MSTICLLTITDRPEYLERTLVSAAAFLPSFDQYVLVEDEAHELGFAGAIAEAWAQLDCDYVFHLEDDFIFHAPVPVDRMVALLERHPELVQVALKRQAVNEAEREAGGIVEANPAAFEERHDGIDTFTVTRSCFTTNPSVYPRWIAARGWPQCPASEGMFGIDLFNERPEWCSAFWGGMFDPPLCEHIGEVRCGVGY